MLTRRTDIFQHSISISMVTFHGFQKNLSIQKREKITYFFLSDVLPFIIFWRKQIDLCKPSRLESEIEKVENPLF